MWEKENPLARAIWFPWVCTFLVLCSHCWSLDTQKSSQLATTVWMNITTREGEDCLNRRSRWGWASPASPPQPRGGWGFQVLTSALSSSLLGQLSEQSLSPQGRDQCRPLQWILWFVLRSPANGPWILEYPGSGWKDRWLWSWSGCRTGGGRRTSEDLQQNPEEQFSLCVEITNNHNYRNVCLLFSRNVTN